MGFTQAILGLSGGIDSAVVYALAIEALGPENVLGVMLPSQYSSDHSINDSIKLAENLSGKIIEVPIQATVNTLLDELNPHFENKPTGLTEENVQARIRAVMLMALSNKHGYILLNTSNKSEASVGYGTLYGDMCGGLSVIGDVYKTRVYQLAQYINRDREIIPENILTKAPSAELRPDQKDSDSLPEYDVLDQVLFQYIELRKGPAEIIAQGFDTALVNRILKLVNTNEYKRYQTPPVLRVTPKAFGTGRRMPIVGKYLS
jgi:NAD+ synthase (glutamine-hydrolysing)